VIATRCFLFFLNDTPSSAGRSRCWPSEHAGKGDEDTEQGRGPVEELLAVDAA
jgi:hypothetical protein